MTIMTFEGTEYLNREHLAIVKANMSQMELARMKNRVDDIVNNSFGFSSYEARLLARDMFELDYLAAHVKLQANEKTET